MSEALTTEILGWQIPKYQCWTCTHWKYTHGNPPFAWCGEHTSLTFSDEKCWEWEVFTEKQLEERVSPEMFEKIKAGVPSE